MNLYKPIVISHSNKYNNIQILRFIAALMVMIVHSSFYASERLQPGSYIYLKGANGVQLFFAISGFVMIMSSEHLTGVSGGWNVFSIKRIIRIIPIYWIITSFKLLLFIFQKSIIYHAGIDLIYIIKSYLFIPAINVDGEFRPFYGVGWTLNFEMFFYFLFAVALALRIKPITFLSIILIPLSVISIYKTSHWPDIGFYADSIVLNFLYGMIAAKLILAGKKLPEKLAITLILAGLLYLFVPRLEFPMGSQLNNFMPGIASFLVVFGCASIESYKEIRTTAWLVYLGGASYSLYLIHPSIAPLAPTLLKILNLKWPLLSVVLSVIIATAAGVAFYKFCEQPLTQFLSKRAKKITVNQTTKANGN